MKIRNGFVSNSSSSSFLIGCRGELKKEKLLDAFKVDKGSPLYPMVLEMAELMVKDVDKYTRDEFINDFCCDEEEFEEGGDGFCAGARKILEKGMDLYGGYASNEGGGVEYALCEIDLDYETEDLIIKKDGGY